MRSKTVGWIVAASVAVLLAAGSLGVGMAGAKSPNSSSSDLEPDSRGPLTDAFVMGAVVGPDGTLDRSTTLGVESDRLGRGAYEVIFPIDVRACTYVATIGKTGSRGSGQIGFITVAGRDRTSNGVYVETHAQRARFDREDRPFHLELSCPPPA